MLRRDPAAHKNQFGHVLILAGSAPMAGAAVLSSLAAMRTGAGLVTVGIPQSVNAMVQKRLSPVIMTWPLPETREGTFAAGTWTVLRQREASFQALAIGPGLGRTPGTRRLVRDVLLQSSCPMVLDADALNVLEGDVKPLTVSALPKVLTPHPGEMARLTGRSRAWVNAHRDAAAQDFSVRHRCVVVLKGRNTVVSGPDGEIYINSTGHVGMATAGSGDVLTGMIVALMGQGVGAFEAARFGVYLHGLAGEVAAAVLGPAAMIAADIITAIPAVLNKKSLGKGCRPGPA